MGGQMRNCAHQNPPITHPMTVTMRVEEKIEKQRGYDKQG
jgi:hypothetical protein